MNTASQPQTLPGWYGKLPFIGDFANRRLPSAFINAWDDWLQQVIHGSRTALGEEVRRRVKDTSGVTLGGVAARFWNRLLSRSNQLTRRARGCGDLLDMGTSRSGRRSASRRDPRTRGPRARARRRSVAAS